MTNDPPKPLPIWTAWPATTGDGVTMARVRLNLGQHSFMAGGEIKPDHSDFAETVSRLIAAVTQHFKERGLLP